MTLTALETDVLALLRASSASNGDDFGLTEDARPACETKRQLSGVIASLVKKGVIVVHDTENGWTQFTWPECGECAGTGRYGFRDDDQCRHCNGFGVKRP